LARRRNTVKVPNNRTELKVNNNLKSVAPDTSGKETDVNNGDRKQ